MMNKERRQKWFCENIGSHLRSWNPCGNERTIGEVLTYKMMSYVDVFGSRRDGICVSDSAGALVVA